MNLLAQQLKALLESEPDVIANAANMASLLFNNLEQVNWVGFYFLKESNEQSKELVLGPFCGQPACTRIPLGKGVCGTAFAQQQTLVVDDVHAFDGHIACDAASQSEIVVPFNFNAYDVDGAPSIAGVLDIDSPIKNRFDDADKHFFEKAMQLYVNACEL